MINISKVDIKEFVRRVYDLSVPQGMGFMQAKPGQLSDKDVEEILSEGSEAFPVSMDYVNGRACKMRVKKTVEGLTINDSWYDHTDEQLKQLLAHFGIEHNLKPDHSNCCNCLDCKSIRFMAKGQSIERA